ncbi:MAG: hypothetical protein LUD39_01095 [Opitutae bacterium]|nr:hypothetical protein [Opitutae bacterium]
MDTETNEETRTTTNAGDDNDSRSDNAAIETGGKKAKPPIYKRLWFMILVPICLIVVIGIVVLLLAPSAVVKCALNKYGAEILQVDKFSVGSLSVNPFTQSLTMRNFVMGHPTTGGDFSEDMVTIDYLNAEVSLAESNGRTKVIIENFTVEGLTTTYEKPLNGKANFDVLLDNLTAASGNKDEAEDSDNNDEEEEEIYVGARRFLVDGATVRMIYSGVPTPLPPVTIDMQNVGIDEDITATEFGMRVAANFLNVLNRMDLSEIGDLLGSGTDSATGAVESVAGGIGNLFGGSDNKDDSHHQADTDNKPAGDNNATEPEQENS